MTIKIYKLRYFVVIISLILMTSCEKRRHTSFDIYVVNNSTKNYIIEYDSLYYMYYTSIGTPRQIRLATSEDLFEWKHFSEKPLFAFKNELTENMKNKDPMVFRHNDEWIIYYSMMKDSNHWVVGYSTSKNLIDWTAPKICFDEHTEEPNVESPFVVKRGNYYYLLLSARPWPNGAQEIFKSKTPYLWN